MRFSQSIAAAALLSLAVAAPVSKDKRVSKFKWFGANESGAEFGTALPGVLGTDYTWPSTSTIHVGVTRNSHRP